MLDNLTIVLVKTKYPENVGAAARACANMGARDIILVDPLEWDPYRARPMATAQAFDIVENVRVEANLSAALAPFNIAYGTTARTGGWRKGLQLPDAAAADIAQELREGGSAAIVFGPEDRGLTNDEIEHCGRLATIPTVGGKRSLNLSQAVLIMLYECFRKASEATFRLAEPPTSRAATHEEQELLFTTLRDTLMTIDYIKPDNPDYWMMPLRRFIGRAPLRRNEFNLLMGICRQVLWVARRAGRKGD